MRMEWHIGAALVHDGVRKPLSDVLVLTPSRSSANGGRHVDRRHIEVAHGNVAQELQILHVPEGLQVQFDVLEKNK